MAPTELGRDGELRSRDAYRGWPVLDGAGQPVGEVDGTFEDAGGKPRFLGLRAGAPGGPRTLLPAEGLEIVEVEELIRTPWTRDRIAAAPRHADGEPFGADLQAAVHDHLGPGPASASVSAEGWLVRSEEELRVGTERRAYGGARLRKSVELEEVTRQVPLHADFVQLHEVGVPDPEADSGEVERMANGDISVPVFEERLVVYKRLVVTKRVLLARERRLVGEQTVSDTLRRERIELEVDRHPEDLARQAGALAGEDLSLGPTAQTRHPHGGHDDVRDTTQGPTPEIRRTMRMDHAPAEGAAAGEPASDSATRTVGGGTQDRTTGLSGVSQQGLGPDPDAELIQVDEPDRRSRDTEADDQPPTTIKERA